jgi:selenocysteine lyase/cysteine desulfurase
MFDPSLVRSEFPALAREQDGRPLVFFDAPGGTQVTRRCLERMMAYLTRHNANTHGAFVTSQESDAILAEAHEAAADLLNAASPAEIVFGQNMTSLTFALSRSIGRTLGEGDEVILTRLDHDANFSPWRIMAAERCVRVHVVDVCPDDCTLALEDFDRYLSPRTRLVAVGYVSNAVGTINPLKRIIEMAHAVGARVFVDAVAAAHTCRLTSRRWARTSWLAQPISSGGRIRAFSTAVMSCSIACRPIKSARRLIVRRINSRPAHRAMRAQPA